MNERLSKAIQALRGLDRTLKPVPFARAREDALVEGLHALAEAYGRKIAFTRIDANGEMDFNIEGEGEIGRYGEELAAVLSRVPWRTGIQSSNTPMLGVNSWCHINHIDVERLLLALADAAPQMARAG